MTFTDIRPTQLINKAPVGVRPYLYLMRLDRPIGWWLLLLPGWWGISLASSELNLWNILLILFFFLGSIIMRGAGCVINDLWDRDIDPYVERTASRPIASKEIGLEDAFIFLGILLLCGLAILILMPPMTIFLGVVSIPLIIAYPLMKRITWWPQAFLGITFNFGALMGWSAVTGELGLAPILLYCAGICWTLGYDTIYAHQDIEDDLRIGVKSTAIKFGENSPKWVCGFYGGALVFFLLAMIFAGVHWYTYGLCAVGFAFIAHKIYQWDPASKESSLLTFKSNKIGGLLLFGALFIDFILT